MGALLQKNMYLLSYSHQITIHEDMQSPLNYNLQYFHFQYLQASGEPFLPYEKHLLLSLSSYNLATNIRTEGYKKILQVQVFAFAFLGYHMWPFYP